MAQGANRDEQVNSKAFPAVNSFFMSPQNTFAHHGAILMIHCNWLIFYHFSMNRLTTILWSRLLWHHRITSGVSPLSNTERLTSRCSQRSSVICQQLALNEAEVPNYRCIWATRWAPQLWIVSEMQKQKLCQVSPPFCGKAVKDFVFAHEWRLMEQNNGAERQQEPANAHRDTPGWSLKTPTPLLCGASITAICPGQRYEEPAVYPRKQRAALGSPAQFRDKN